MPSPDLIELPVIRDDRGFVAVAEHAALPFVVRRMYFLGDVPGDAVRGEHAHRELTQLIVAVRGAVTVTLDDGATREQFLLDRPGIGLLVPPRHWRELRDFASGTVVVVLASHEYDEGDYIRDHDEFLEWVTRG